MTDPLWQSGYLSHATAELMTEFSTIDPREVMDAFSVAIDQVPVAEGTGSLLQRSRQILQARIYKSV